MFNANPNPIPIPIPIPNANAKVFKRRMCCTRHLTQVAATVAAALCNVSTSHPHGHIHGTSSGDSGAYAINTLTCYLVVNTQRRLLALSLK